MLCHHPRVPRITGSSIEEHRRQTAERILLAFDRLLAERGYDALTLADIAAEAGIGRTVMYNYFPDKESLLLEYTARETDTYRQRLDAALARCDDPLDKLRVFIRMQLRELTMQHVPAGSLVAVLSEAGRRRMVEHVEPLSRTLRDILEQAQAQGVLPQEDLQLMLPLVTAAISGRGTVALRGRELDRAIEATTTFVLRGLGASHTPPR